MDNGSDKAKNNASRSNEFQQHLDQSMPFRIPIELLKLITSYVMPSNECRVESRSVKAKRLHVVAVSHSGDPSQVKSYLFYGNDCNGPYLYPLSETDLQNKDFDFSLCPPIKIPKPEWLYREGLWCILDSAVWSVRNGESDGEGTEAELERFTIDSNGVTEHSESIILNADCTSMCSVHQHKQVWLQTSFSRDVETGKYPAWNSNNNGYPIEVLDWSGQIVKTIIPSHDLIGGFAAMAFDGSKYVWLIDGHCKVMLYDAQTFGSASESEMAKISNVLLTLTTDYPYHTELKILQVRNEMWIFLFHAGLLVIFDIDFSFVLTRSFPKHQQLHHNYVFDAFILESDVYVQSNNTLTRIY